MESFEQRGLRACIVGELLITVSALSVSEEAWRDYAAWSAEVCESGTVVAAFTWNHGPPRRFKTTKLRRVALLTRSAAARGAINALSWLKPEIKGFDLGATSDVLSWLAHLAAFDRTMVERYIASAIADAMMPAAIAA